MKKSLILLAIITFFGCNKAVSDVSCWRFYVEIETNETGKGFYRYSYRTQEECGMTEPQAEKYRKGLEKTERMGKYTRKYTATKKRI